jgi:uncharacterized membrane protein
MVVREPGAPVVEWQPSQPANAHMSKWLSEGWQLMQGNIGFFMLLTLVFIILSSVVPIILQGPLIAGMHMCFMKRIQGRQPEFADLFQGFNFFVPTLVASLCIGLFTFAGGLLCIIPGLVVAAMYKFTYLFIVDKGMDFWPAMKASHAVVKNDYVGFTLFLVVMGLLQLAGALCLFVGLLVTIHWSIAAVTAAYRDIVGFEPRTVERLTM